MGATNTVQRWRQNKADGGILMEVDSSAVVGTGLCMPHSPRVYRCQSFVLDSGRGHLCVVDRETGTRSTIAELPGYARGFAFAVCFAFVGLPKIRDKRIFSGLPIADRYNDEERKCGLCVTGAAEWLRDRFR